ncbi:MAG: tetratricopeptide repeat protein [Nitrospinae bacterium]|nr:tetratricopeptide repeat protein [Nitrospinota bacterium]MZH04634.1 tetratricopeptide repeat protein [Nitrospinota bacterium]MZH13979.1 tetratricopeptide repeat protein [Nitrospinota bacterium]
MSEEEKQETSEIEAPEESPPSEEPPTDLKEEEAPESEEEELEDEDEEEIEFDLEAQVEEFRRLIEEDPDNCVNFYNLGEALAELGQTGEAREAFEQALELDKNQEFSSIIHLGIGNLYYHQLMSGIQSNVVKSSVGMLSQHKQQNSISSVSGDDYSIPINEFEKAIQFLPTLNADEEIVDYVRKNAPKQISTIYYKWASDLFDKARQLEHYGDEIKDIKQGLKFLKKTIEIDPNHAQANLMVKYGKKMLVEGFSIYDEYGFEAKIIPGSG